MSSDAVIPTGRVVLEHYSPRIGWMYTNLSKKDFENYYCKLDAPPPPATADRMVVSAPMSRFLGAWLSDVENAEAELLVVREKCEAFIKENIINPKDQVTFDYNCNIAFIGHSDPQVYRIDGTAHVRPADGSPEYKLLLEF